MPELVENKRCEWCEVRAIADVHHLAPRGMGGTKREDKAEELIGVCRKCHEGFESGKFKNQDGKEKVLKILRKKQ